VAAYCRVIHREDERGDLTMMAFVPGLPETLGWYWHTWPLWYGGEFWDEERGRVPISSEPFVRGLQWIRDLTDAFGQRRVLRFESGLANFNSPDNPFMTRTVAMVQQGPWFAHMIREYAPEINYGVAPFPTGGGNPISYNGQDALAIPTGAAHPDEAWTFIEWLYTAKPIHVQSREPEPQFGYDIAYQNGARVPMPALRPIEWLCWNHYKNSPLADPAPEFLATHPNPAIAVHERLARSSFAKTDPRIPNWTEIHEEFKAAYRDIWGSPVPVRERLEECQKRVDTLVDLARRRQARYGLEFP
jgi:hypothetical protein